MSNLNDILIIMEDGINEVLEQKNVAPIDKLQCIETLTASFIAIVKDFRFIHTLKKEDSK